MREQRRGGTAPELAVRATLRDAGVRYRLANRDLPGSPDLANRARRWAVFVHGCFWHHHEGCRRATVPAANRDFWLDKFAGNRARDARVADALRSAGYRVVVVWECETVDRAHLHRLAVSLRA
ncbi:MAG: very short patch repair endonuclease [Myxococcota bacterium]